MSNAMSKPCLQANVPKIRGVVIRFRKYDDDEKVDNKGKDKDNRQLHCHHSEKNTESGRDICVLQLQLQANDMLENENNSYSHSLN